MKKKVLVTGGAGFVGSHLCRRLLSEGNEVICLDNFFTGRKVNVVDLLENPNFELIRHDVQKEISLHVNEIYNLACPASPPFYQKDPVDTTKTSVLGAINMLELAVKCDAKILQASTSEVYGDPMEHPQSEEYRGNVSITGIRSCYDEGKRCSESLFFDFHRMYGTKIKVARIFNTYGPSMNPDDGRVVSNFIVQALNGENITIYGDGVQTRSFQYIDDLIEGLVSLMESDDSIMGPFNLGNPHEFTIKELAEKIIAKTNSESILEYKDLPQDDPLQRKPEIKKAYDELGWKPKVELNEGLNKTINYFKLVREGKFS